MPQTNIVFFELPNAAKDSKTLAIEAASKGLKLSAVGRRLRAVTHLDVTKADIDAAVEIVRSLVLNA
jgi:threonine aldolase